MEYILELEHIKKSFLGVQALQDMSLAVRPGEVHAIVGENGAGKSTLIKIIAGAYQPDSGSMRLMGEEAHFTGAAQSLKQGISVIYQETSLFPDLSVVENLFVGSYPRRGILGAIDYGRMERQAREVFAQFGLHIDVRRKVGNLSIAMKQIVEIAKAMWRESSIVIMDEPTASLSEKEVETLFAVVRRIKEKGATVIYISHRLEELFRVADRVTVIRDGCFVKSMLLKDTDKDELVALMVGRKIAGRAAAGSTAFGPTVLEVSGCASKGFWKISIFP